MLIAGIGRPDLNRDGRRERTAMSLLGSMGLPGSLTRRRFLAGSAAAGATAGLGSWAARAAPNLSGVTLNLMVIQPHVVGGRMVGEAFEKATGAKANVIAVRSSYTDCALSAPGCGERPAWWFKDRNSAYVVGEFLRIPGTSAMLGLWVATKIALFDVPLTVH